MDTLKERILIVDDDPDIRKILQDRLENLGYRVSIAVNGKEALDKISVEDPELMLLDLQIPEIDGMEVLRRARDYPGLVVIIITAFGTVERAVEAMREGAYNFITKPFSAGHLEMIINRALTCRFLQQENLFLHGEIETSHPEILGRCQNIKKVIEVSKRVATTSSTVFLMGESGTGKEVFARAIHRWSQRSMNPFIVVNCVSLKDELLESEVFGHEKGAFTGAHQRKRGKMEIANGGTIFLDEIADLRPGLQAKFLRILQEAKFERVGGNKTISTDVRFIAATNQNIPVAIQEGRFREDLFFRLNVVSVQIPPLRERKEDIPLLTKSFFRRSCQSLKRPKMRISREAIDHLIRYDWPGNVRELENLIERSVILTKGNEIMPEDLPFQLAHAFTLENLHQKPYQEAVRSYQRELIGSVLQKTGGNQAKAAEILNLQRTYLSRLMKKLNIKKD